MVVPLLLPTADRRRGILLTRGTEVVRPRQVGMDIIPTVVFQQNTMPLVLTMDLHLVHHPRRTTVVLVVIQVSIPLR